MRRTPAATYLWPGLPRLWVDGSWAGLAEALAFALLVDGLVLASWVWTEWLGAGWLRCGWLCAVMLWIGAAVVSGWSRRASAGQRATSGGKQSEKIG